MKEKINIAEILKDKPENTKLYSPLFGDVYFSDVEDCFIKVTHHGGRMVRFFDNGIYYNYPESEPLLFPSREMRDWRKFAWKKGDVLYSAGLKEYCVFNKFISDGYLMFISNYNVDENTKRVVPKTYDPDKNTVNYEKVSDEKATEIISLIEEHYGGKLNLSTLEIEKQPEFKDGDILSCDEDTYTKHTTLILHKNGCVVESLVSLIRHHDLVESREPINEVLLSRLYYAREDEKKELFDALEKEGKAWDAVKKQIVELKPKVEFKPFDKVVVRDTEYSTWCADFFSHIDVDYRYACVGATWSFCIPYNEETAKLIGTTNNVEG